MKTKKEKEQAKTGDVLIPFGKFKMQKLKEVDIDYLKWGSENLDDKNKWKSIFSNEIERRDKNI
jgi:hypothetical protein